MPSDSVFNNKQPTVGFTFPIHIIGLGVSERAELSREALEALQQSQWIIGSERQYQTVQHVFNNALNNTECNNAVLAKTGLSQSEVNQPQWLALPKLKQLKQMLWERKTQRIVVLASGDPLFYGIGRWFVKHIGIQHCCFHPAVSSIQAACHRLGFSLQDVHVVSLHGRAIETVRPQLQANRTLAILTDKQSNPRALAQECVRAGFAESTLSVCENLGYTEAGVVNSTSVNKKPINKSAEKIRHFSVNELINDTDLLFDPLHVTLIKVKGHGGVLPSFPGFPDTLFATGAAAGKGMISKREVRLCILSLLQVSDHDVVWDIGAGCGGVAVELAYWNPTATVYAIECHKERLQHLLTNCLSFGVSNNLHIIDGRAPEVLDKLSDSSQQPTKVFIGGSDGELAQLLQDVWRQLPDGGVLVASAVIDKTKQQLQKFAESLLPHQVETVELGVNRGQLVPKILNESESKHISTNNYQMYSLSYEKKLPVEIFKFSKCFTERVTRTEKLL